MSDHDDIRDALQRVTPELDVPDGLVAGALRRRRRTRGLVSGGAAALVVALAVPVALNLGSGSQVTAQATPEAVLRAASPDAAPLTPAALPASGEDQAAEESGAPPEAQAAESSPERAAEASQRLGWEVIQASTEANRVVSPSSLSMSLVQAAEGAEGASLQSIDEALGLTGDARAESFAALREALLPYDSLPDSVDADDPPETPVVHQASRILAIGTELKQPFLERIARFYDASAESTTLDEAKANLDAWARLHTAGLIEESVIEPDEITTAVLQDALHFAAAWDKPFTTTLPIEFQTPDGTAQVEGVSGGFTVAHAESPRWTAVRLPYDDQLAADIILPAEGLSPLDLTADDLRDAATALSEAPEVPLQVLMPTLELAVKTNLLEALPQIDLSNMGGIHGGATGLTWVQQAKLIVTGSGTVGAALTEMGFTFASTRSGFTVDRPYVLRVLDTSTGWPLFLATVSDPGAQS